MSLVLFNPTNERMSALHEGIELWLEPYPKNGHMVKVHDAKGHHIINALGPRGICLLDYDDHGKEDEIAETGRARNLEFKKRQVVRYNQDNKAREQSLKPYIDPTAQVKRYAEEVGIELLEPYVTEDVKNKKISDLEKRLTDQSEEMRTMMAQMTKMMEAQTGVTTPTPEEAEADAIKQEYNMLQKSALKQWVAENKERYPTFPLEIQEHLAAKWARVCEEPFPT